MRLALALAALLAVAASPRGGCGKAPQEPCAGMACGAPCTACAPGDAGCLETAVVKACDPAGGCVAAGTFTCTPTPADPCAGKTCGESCAVDPPCRSATPPCMVPTLLGKCDAAGLCVAADVVCAPPGPCAGKACGEPCSLCGAVPCMSPVATVCDRSGACVPTAPALCEDPCAGKACHAPCDPCPAGSSGCAAVLCVTWCDGAGQCRCAGGGELCP